MYFIDWSVRFISMIRFAYTRTACSGGISISRIKTHSAQRQYRASAFNGCYMELFTVMTYLNQKSPILISYAYRTLRDPRAVELQLTSLYKSPLWERYKAYRNSRHH